MKDVKMVEIPMTKLLEICSEVYQSGLSGCGDLREDAIEDSLIKHGVSIAERWKVFTIKELAELTVNTILIHSIWGRCWICERPEGKVKYMSFLHRGPVDFRSNSDPWDKPMKIISISKLDNLG